MSEPAETYTTTGACDSSSASVPGPRINVRISVLGNVDAGKSSCVGVLTKGELDDGRGSARTCIFVHKHEKETGRTSCIARQSMGYRQSADTQDITPVFYKASASSTTAHKNRAWKELVEQSEQIVDFIDLAGHEKYARHTVRGISGGFPDYALILVNALAGITKLTKEHLGLVHALDIPMLLLISKVDLAPPNILERTKVQIKKTLSMAGRRPLMLRTQEDVKRVFELDPQHKLLCPVIQVSFVQGTNIDLVHTLLAALRPRPLPIWFNLQVGESKADRATEFCIDEVYSVHGVGLVVSGLVVAGQVHTDDVMWLGPLAGSDPTLGQDGSAHQADNTIKVKPSVHMHPARRHIPLPTIHKYHYIAVQIRSIHQYRATVADEVNTACSCAIAIRPVNRKYHLARDQIYRGACLLQQHKDSGTPPLASSLFEANVKILHHATTIKPGYEVTTHVGMVRQSMRLIKIQDKSLLRDGDQAVCTFRLLKHAIYMHPQMKFVFREGFTKGVGAITRYTWTTEELEQLQTDEHQMLYERRHGTGSERSCSTSPALHAPSTATVLT